MKLGMVTIHCHKVRQSRDASQIIFIGVGIIVLLPYGPIDNLSQQSELQERILFALKVICQK
jgi:hypothetical protein